MYKCAKVVTAVFLTIACGVCIFRLFHGFWLYITDKPTEVDFWLEQNELKKYKQLFRDRGKVNYL